MQVECFEPDVLLSEFFDNSLYAGAKWASIDMNTNAEGQPCLRIRDDGVRSNPLFLWLFCRIVLSRFSAADAYYTDWRSTC